MAKLNGVEWDEEEWQRQRERELQPCGHPVQAIRSTPYIGEQHSNWCGWCADVAQFEREHELCQTLTAELLEYRGRVARLREALEIARKPLDALSPDWPILGDFIRAHEVVEAALSDTAAIREAPTP